MTWNRSWVRWAALAALTAGCGMLLLVPGIRDGIAALLGAVWSGDGSGVRDTVQGYGILGPAVSILLAVLHTVVPFPAEVLALANGLAFGFWGGLATTWSGFMLAAVLTYGAGLIWGRPVMSRFVAEKHRVRLEGWLSREGFFPLLVLRLIPLVPFNALCLACGVVRVKPWTYVWTTGLGILPLDIALSLVGSRLGTEASPGVGYWLFIAALVVAVSVAWLVSRRLRRVEPEKTPDLTETGKGPKG